jgi:hypothetical protein
MRAMTPWWAAMAAMVGCRVQEPGPPVVAAEQASVEAASVEAAPVEGTEALPPEAAPVEPEGVPARVEAEPMPPPPAVVPIETPFPADALVMQRVSTRMPLVLFDDEVAAIRRRAAGVLAARGVKMVPIAEVERIEAAAAEGRLVLEGDRRCRAPLTPDEVAARYFPGRPQLTISADCFDDCRLTMAVDDPPDYADGRAWNSPKVTRPHDPRAWLAAAGRLRPTQTIGFGGLGFFGTSHSPPVRFESLVGIGPWAEGLPEEAPFSALEGRVAGCAHPDPLAGFTWQLRASVARDGAVTRCTAHSEHSMAHAGGAACLCGAVETMRFPAGKAGRRLRVKAVDDGGFGRPARLDLVQPGTEPWVTRLNEASALSRCFDASPLPGMLAARVLLALAPDGAVEDVRVEGDITTTASMGFASCLVQELRTVPLPCRPPGVDTLHLSLVVNGP